MKTATPPGNSPPTSILIVGAGAVGLVMGYHLTRGGAAVTFMVRPQRVEASQATQYLFCYDDCELKEYADFAVTSTAREVAGGRFDYVLLTLDGGLPQYGR